MPTDTILQTWAQALGGSGYAMGALLAAAFIITGAVIGIIGAVLESRQRRFYDEQIRLERSVDRARSGQCYSQSYHPTGNSRRSE